MGGQWPAERFSTLARQKSRVEELDGGFQELTEANITSYLNNSKHEVSLRR